MTRRVLELIGSSACGTDERTAREVSDRLDRAEFDAQIITRSGERSVHRRIESAEARAAHARDSEFDWAHWWRLRQTVRQSRPDLVHVWPSAGLAGSTATVMAGVGKVILAMPAPPAGEPWYVSLVTRRLAARSAALVVDCTAVAACWTARGWPAKKIRIVAPGVAPVLHNDRTKTALLTELGLPNGSRLIAVVGALELRERIKDLIWAADLLKVIRDDVHLLVIGDGPHRARLERYTRLCHIRDKVHFLDNRRDPDELLPGVDVCWRASSRPGLPMAVLKAMAAGVPVVAADAPGMAELVTHDQTGYLVPIGDRAGLARYTNSLLDDPQVAGRLAAAARERVVRDFTLETMVDRLAAVYREVCG